MRPYTYKPQFKGYFIPNEPGSTAGVTRPNRTAAGMTATMRRSKKDVDSIRGDVLTLMVRGTLARVPALMYAVTRGPATTCPCCAQDVRRLRLNASGKRRLATLRARRAAR